ncbi:MAG: CCA tRNA nucleotidyltransferase [Desulfamplus sp.]|nr:CCA tRNA nucleotidyltransferase [Desulfamplus sp.]
MIEKYIQKKNENHGHALGILKELHDKGFQALFVGGTVRDMLMDIKSRDFDIVTDAPMEVIPHLFNCTESEPVGKTFPVFIINGVEVASCRSMERNTPFPVGDLEQRDLTINSMAYDPFQDNLMDPFGGQRDLKEKIIRFTGDPESRIAEDPIRMVRACRFLSAIEGRFENDSLEAIKEHAPKIMNNNMFVRINAEIMKAMAHKKPSIFFRALHRTGLLAMIFPSLNRCGELDGGPYHGETVLEHCLLTGDALSPGRPLLRLAGYLHDAGKYDAAEIKDGGLTFIDHEKMTHAVVRDLEKLGFSTRDVRRINGLIKTHMRPLKADSTPKAVRRLISFLKEHNITWKEFMRMRIADKSANLAKSPYNPGDIKLRVLKIHGELNKTSKNAFTLKDLALTGRDVMEILSIPQGRAVGKAMQDMFDMVMENPEMNSREKLKGHLTTHWKGKYHG